jgi:ADP-ribose pyrophosphatase YjhB (NUDIX family)
MPDDRRDRVGSYAVIIDDGRILLARIASGYPNEGHWTLPGGGVDTDEHPKDTLVREVHEETGLTLDSFVLAGVDSEELGELAGRPVTHAVRFIYRCEASGELTVIEENGSTDAAAWFPLEDLDDLPTVGFIERAIKIAT